MRTTRTKLPTTKTNMQPNYSILAKYYDKFTQNDCDYVSWSQYLYKIATARGVREVVDLACGTGKMTALLSEQGLKLTGVDVSNEMLNEARAKCRANFIQQDMRKFQLTHAQDMAVCVNDGVNYLKPSELTPFFECVAANIKNGAPFVFDVSSPYKLTERIGNNVFYLDDEEETLLWSNTLKGNCVQMNLTLFVANGKGYDRYDERHTQYIHTQSEVEQALEIAGFTIAEVTAEYGKKVAFNSSRLTFYAVKNR